MGKDIYKKVKPEKEKKVRKPVNKDSLIIGIVVAVILLLTAGIVAYYFVGMNSKVVATYEGGEIQRGEYEAVYRYMAPSLAYMGYDPDVIYRLILDQVLLNEVMYNEAKAAGFELTVEQKKEVDSHLSNQDNIDSLVSQGVDIEQLRKFLYENAVLTTYLDDKQAKTTVDQVKEYIIAEEGEDADLNVYKTSHILLAFESGMTDDDKAALLKEANTVLSKAKKGDDFAKLAEEYSDDTYSKTNGGKIDMLNNGSFTEEYTKAVLSLKAGKLYGSVVETDYGYHIIKLDSIEKDGRLTYEEDLSSYINSYISDKVTAAFDYENEENKKEMETLKELGLKFDGELGIVHSTVTE